LTHKKERRKEGKKEGRKGIDRVEWECKLIVTLFFLLFLRINIQLYYFFICAYNVWVISSPLPYPLPYPPPPPSPPYLLATRQKLFCPYL
jgi:hypothetical protein